MQMDTLADALTSILNAEKTGKKTVTVKPASKIIANVLRTVQRAGYLGELEYIENNRDGMFDIQLLGRINKCGVIKPRFPVNKDHFEDEERKYLPARGFGILVVTTLFQRLALPLLYKCLSWFKQARRMESGSLCPLCDSRRESPCVFLYRPKPTIS